MIGNDTGTDWMRRSACSAPEVDPNLFFPRSYRKVDLDVARAICRECPVFEHCRRWSTLHYPEIPEGIFFGEAGPRRQLIAEKLQPWEDWRRPQRKGPRRRSIRQLRARELAAQEAGVPAVVNIVKYFDTDDPVEKKRILDEYRNWQASESYTFDERQAEKRMADMATVLRRRLAAGALDPAAVAVAQEYLQIAPAVTGPLEPVWPHLAAIFRPHCPEGHGQQPMHLIGPRAGVAETWVCYQCRSKVDVGERQEKKTG